MIEYIGLCIENDIKRIKVSLKVWYQNFDGSAWVAVAHSPDGGCPYLGPTIRKIISSNRGEHAVFKTHFSDRISDSWWLSQIKLRRFASLDRTKGARTGTDIPKYHQCSCTPGPTFTHVWALSTLANGVELVVVHKIPNPAVFWSRGQFCSKPTGFTRFRKRITHGRI